MECLSVLPTDVIQALRIVPNPHCVLEWGRMERREGGKAGTFSPPWSRLHLSQSGRLTRSRQPRLKRKGLGDDRLPPIFHLPIPSDCGMPGNWLLSYHDPSILTARGGPPCSDCSLSAGHWFLPQIPMWFAKSRALCAWIPTPTPTPGSKLPHFWKLIISVSVPYSGNGKSNWG